MCIRTEIINTKRVLFHNLKHHLKFATCGGDPTNADHEVFILIFGKQIIFVNSFDLVDEPNRAESLVCRDFNFKPILN
jgi:hypothetical protein